MTTAYTKFPYRTEFPDSSERGCNSKTLEDALSRARWHLYRIWRETNEYGREGDYIYDTETAVITNRNSGYRWVLRRDDQRVEFQTPEMLRDAVAEQSVELHLTVEEAEALARSAVDAEPRDHRQKALVGQVLDQIAVVCRQVRERIEAGDELIDAWTRAIPRRPPSETPPSALEQDGEPPRERPRYRPLGDPDNLSLKEAGEILGRKRNTVYLWYRQGKFPPALDVSPYLGSGTKPVIVVPRYRLEAWQSGEPMPPIPQEVFETRGLREAPWACLVRRRAVRNQDVEFWVNRHGLRAGISSTGTKIYGLDLEEGRSYELGGAARAPIGVVSAMSRRDAECIPNAIAGGRLTSSERVFYSADELLQTGEVNDFLNPRRKSSILCSSARWRSASLDHADPTDVAVKKS